MGQATLLRTLTKKSVLKFGKYAELQVFQLLNLKKNKYIRFCYFNLSAISFTDDILDEVLIPKNYRIQKPGTNKEIYDKLEHEIESRIYGLTKYILEKKLNKRLKAKAVSRMRAESIFYSKASLQSRNHGH